MHIRYLIKSVLPKISNINWIHSCIYELLKLFTESKIFHKKADMSKKLSATPKLLGMLLPSTLIGLLHNTTYISIHNWTLRLPIYYKPFLFTLPYILVTAKFSASQQTITLSCFPYSNLINSNSLPIAQRTPDGRLLLYLWYRLDFSV